MVAKGAPPRMRAIRFRLGSEEHAILSYHVPAVPAPGALTPAELDVVFFVLAGLPTAEIARRRGTSARTVANQIASIFRKTRVRSRAELVVRWSAR